MHISFVSGLAPDSSVRLKGTFLQLQFVSASPTCGGVKKIGVVKELFYTF